MTDQKIIKVLDLYEKYLREQNCNPYKFDPDAFPHNYAALDHLLAMIPQMRKFLEQGRREKVFRWLGFMQGVLWLSKKFTLNDVKNHNRSDALTETQIKGRPDHE